LSSTEPPSTSTHASEDALTGVFRGEAARIVATLTRLLGDIDLAEDAVQEALAAAVERWPRDGTPDRPGAWLMTTARNKALDHLRRERTQATAREAALRLHLDDESDPASPFDGTPIPDDRLALLFTCCHPALAMEARVALTLRLIGGLTTPEIARAFLVQESTMAQRLVRAKHKIRAARIPIRVPPLCDEAIRLARLTASLMPADPEAAGLLALLLLTHSRRGERQGDDGGLRLLREQDRSRWDHAMIDEGRTVLEAALLQRRPGRYQVEAAIAAVHSDATSMEDTDWAEIAALYATLREIAPSAIVALNHAVALAESGSPAAGLALADDVSEALDSYHLLHSTRAELLVRLGRTGEAVSAYDRALELATNDAERTHLARRRDDAVR
jgi:RNA polymerase sigma-70 factor (ECF subfamily)